MFNQTTTEAADFVIKASVCGSWSDIMTLFITELYRQSLFLICITYLHRDQRVVFFPVQHVNIVGK